MFTAIRLPLGDHVGQKMLLSRSRRIARGVGFRSATTERAPHQGSPCSFSTYASRVPSGDHVGSESEISTFSDADPPVTIVRACVPSARATRIRSGRSGAFGWEPGPGRMKTSERPSGDHDG